MLLHAIHADTRFGAKEFWQSLFVGIYSKKLFPVWNWQTIYQLKDLVITKRAGTFSKENDCPDLFSNHEEVNTRMLLHAIHADTRFGDMNVKGCIIIKSPDTDVLLLCIHFFPYNLATKFLETSMEVF
jgi:hypothetical protein